jgi:predicted dehydrogenase
MQVKTAVVGLGKMGVSHLSIANAIPQLDVVAVCDSSAILGQMVGKYTGLNCDTDFERVLATPDLAAVIIATPTRLHERMIASALDRGLHVFAEKPLTLSSVASETLADRAEAAERVAQVGFHYRFVGTFREAKRLLDAGAIGRVTHIMAEAYGPVVLKPSNKTWRSSAQEGGGCLYDYAAHPLNLMNWYFGRPTDCAGAILANPLSAEVDDAVYATMRFGNGVTGQLSVNWSDDSVRKMTTRVSIWGDKGKIFADRQELQLHCNGTPPEGYNKGWTVRNITELTDPVSFYLRGEEYSAQLEAFGASILDGRPVENSFRSAAETDRTIEMIRAASAGGRVAAAAVEPVRARSRGRFFGLGR